MATPTITWGEIQQHACLESCWIVAHGRVYDVTSLAQGKKWHPGGGAIILDAAGTDASALFDMHNKSTQQRWSTYCIGLLARNAGSCAVQ
jgi:cytochrome b involved in lipid metabolism